MLCGYWRHWFCDRKPTFVRYDVESGFIEEIARTPAQLTASIVVQCTIGVDQKMSHEIREFGIHFGLSSEQLDALARIIMKHGDNPEILTKLSPFSPNAPRSMCEASPYTGDFPAEDEQLGPDIAPIEVGVELENSEQGVIDAIEAGDLKAAWMLLNQRGWSPSELSRHLDALSSLSTDLPLKQLTSEWTLEHREVDWTI